MTTSTKRRGGSLALRLAAVVVVVLVLGALAVVFLNGSKNTVTAYFDQTVNLYPRDEVRVLGVKVGEIESVEPSAENVKVVMSYDSDVEIPADATAAIISPTLVGVRYVQLGPPAKDGQPLLQDGAEIPRERTVSPVEFDQIKTQLTGLASALAPENDKTDGALKRVLDTTAANLDGNGATIKDTIQKLSAAATTLSNGREDLFATVRNLQTFVTALKDSDDQVNRFQSQLADVSGLLADNRKSLGQVVEALDRAAPVVENFIRDHRENLVTDVSKLNDVVANLSANRQALADVLQKAPFALSNFVNFIDEQTGAVTANVAATNFRDPAAFVCDAVAATAPGGPANPDAAYACRTGLGPLLDLARVGAPPVGVNPVEVQDGSPEPLSPILPRGNR